MWRTNLAVALTVIGTLAVYTALANMIPQIESDVPVELTLSADVSSEELVAAGEVVFNGAGGCTACHGLGTRAPDLLGVAGSACASREPGKDCKTYLYEALTSPSVYVVDGFQPIMPDMSRTLSQQQVWATIAFLQSQGGTVTVTASDFASGGDSGGDSGGGGPDGAESGSAAAGGGTAIAASPDDPAALIDAAGCLACHKLGDAGGPVGPAFAGMGALGAEYIRTSILYPNADTAQGYEPFAGTMPATFGEQLTAAQLESIVRFLAEQ
jgi:mono/diheme cytochrome c family protein